MLANVAQPIARAFVYARSVSDTNDVKLEDLAGATLDTVTVDWRNGIVLIGFLSVGKREESCAIRAADFSRVEVPRSSGAAARHVKSAARAGDTLVIVMESGESLRVQSASFAIDTLGG